METSTVDLLFLDADPRTGQPSACVWVSAGGSEDFAGVSKDRLLTTPCATFIELDAEVRRLQAELDEIRRQAKRKFYRTETATAGA